ncbi:hypothetical protein BH10CYA1_BH10CYA1_59930 [soil metagenome]
MLVDTKLNFAQAYSNFLLGGTQAGLNTCYMPSLALTVGKC